MARATGNLTATTGGEGVSVVTLPISQNVPPQEKDNQALIGASGTYGTVTVTITGRIPGGTIYYPLNAVNLGTGQPTIGTTISPTNNTSNAWLVNLPDVDSVKINCTAVTSGTMAVEMYSSRVANVPPFGVNQNKALA